MNRLFEAVDSLDNYILNEDETNNVVDELVKIYNADEKSMQQIESLIDDNDIDIDLKTIIDKEAPMGPPQAEWAVYTWVERVALAVIDILDKNKGDEIRAEEDRQRKESRAYMINPILDILKRNAPKGSTFYFDGGERTLSKQPDGSYGRYDRFGENAEDFAELLAINLHDPDVDFTDEKSVISAVNNALDRRNDLDAYVWNIETPEGKRIDKVK